MFIYLIFIYIGILFINLFCRPSVIKTAFFPLFETITLQIYFSKINKNYKKNELNKKLFILYLNVLK